MVEHIISAGPRQYRRFKALDGAYVLLKTHHAEMLGFLSDFSRGGLSFEYIPTEEISEQDFQVVIVSDDKNIHIEIPSCKKIFEFELEDTYYTPVKMHRVGVQFNEIVPRKFDDFADLVCPEEN